MKKPALYLFAFAALAFTSACSSNNTDHTETTTTDSATVMHDSAHHESTAVPAEDTKDASGFIKEAGSGGMMEVELGKLASQKSTNADVKQFAEMIVKDHTEANNELMTITTQLNMPMPGTMIEKHQKHVDEMRQMNGADFDKHYIDMMVEDHEEDIDLFEKAADKDYEPQIKAFAAKTLPTLRKHHERAKQLHDMMEKKS